MGYESVDHMLDKFLETRDSSIFDRVNIPVVNPNLLDNPDVPQYWGLPIKWKSKLPLKTLVRLAKMITTMVTPVHRLS